MEYFLRCNDASDLGNTLQILYQSPVTNLFIVETELSIEELMLIEGVCEVELNDTHGSLLELNAQLNNAKESLVRIRDQFKDEPELLSVYEPSVLYLIHLLEKNET